MRLGGLGLAVLAATWATVATTSGWPGRLPLHLACYVAAGLFWLLLLALLPRLAPTVWDRRLIWIVALLIRLPAWLTEPAHSDDAFRYAWDGRVTRAGINPYRFAPTAPPLAGLRDGATVDPPLWERASPRPSPRGGSLWARINNPDLPTIYPPAAQLAFAVAALLPLPPIAALKLLFALADLAVLALLEGALRRRREDPRWALAWGWSPLVAVEVGLDAHLEALPILALTAALTTASFRPLRIGLWLGLATAAKLVTAPLLLATRRPRLWLAAAAVGFLVTLPFLGAGWGVFGSSGEFARRWRGNDGLYGVVQGLTDRLVCGALGAPRVERPSGPACDRPLDLWPRQELATLISGRPHRAAVYPDELSAFVARGIIAALLGAVVLGLLLRRRDLHTVAEWTLGALLLGTPALHPWYVTWLLPLAALRRRPAWLVLAALVPLGYLPLQGWLAGEGWRDPLWTRLVVHGATWLLLLLELRPRRRELVGAEPAGTIGPS